MRLGKNLNADKLEDLPTRTWGHYQFPVHLSMILSSINFEEKNCEIQFFFETHRFPLPSSHNRVSCMIWPPSGNLGGDGGKTSRKVNLGQWSPSKHSSPSQPGPAPRVERPVGVVDLVLALVAHPVHLDHLQPSPCHHLTTWFSQTNGIAIRGFRAGCLLLLVRK